MEEGKTVVRIINENGIFCAEGIYYGTGIPSKDLKVNYPTLKHYAVLVEGQMRYYPTGFNTLVVKIK